MLDPLRFPPEAPVPSDNQRAKVLGIERRLGGGRPVSAEDARRLCLAACGEASPTVQSVPEAAVSYHRDRELLEVGPANTVAVLHALAHHLTDAVFPPHGAEWAARFIGLLERFEPSLAGRYREEYDRLKVHRGPGDRVRIVRKRATGAANRQPGCLSVVVVDDPPEELVCQLVRVEAGGLVVRDERGDQLVPNERLRYFASAEVDD